MRLTSRERVSKTFAHEEPDRVPIWIGSSPEFWAKLKQHTGIDDEDDLRVRLGDDFRHVKGLKSPALHPGAKARKPALCCLTDL